MGRGRGGKLELVLVTEARRFCFIITFMPEDYFKLFSDLKTLPKHPSYENLKLPKILVLLPQFFLLNNHKKNVPW